MRPRELASGLLMLLWLHGCEPGGREDAGPRLPPPPDSVPAMLATGQRLYLEHCVDCHGDHARGTPDGPPLVHPVYRSSHHADVAFQLAVQRGVRAHHWRFGDMPPVPGVAAGDVREIVRYVRWLQVEAGIEG